MARIVPEGGVHTFPSRAERLVTRCPRRHVTGGVRSAAEAAGRGGAVLGRGRGLAGAPPHPGPVNKQQRASTSRRSGLRRWCARSYSHGHGAGDGSGAEPLGSLQPGTEATW